MNNKTKILGRRSFIKKTSVAALGTAIGSTGITGFPTIWAQNIKNVTLRQFGTGVSNINAIAKKAKEDLGINLEMTALDTDSTAQRVVTQPKSFDIADIEYFTLKKVWPSGNMQPMDINNGALTFLDCDINFPVQKHVSSQTHYCRQYGRGVHDC